MSKTFETSGQTTSVWMNESVPEPPALTTGAHADVCIVGAGISGITLAYCLIKEGKSVIVLDDRQLVCASASGNIDDILKLGLDRAREHLLPPDPHLASN